MTAYYIDPGTWEDERFNTLTMLGRCVWLYLLTGRCRSIFPGLIITQPQIIASRIPPATTESVEEEFLVLIKQGMIEFDRPRSLVRVVNAPRYARCANSNILKGWYRIWKDLPRSVLKYTHLPGLYDDCIAREAQGVRTEWQRLFQPELESWQRQGSLQRVSERVPQTVSGTVPITVSPTVTSTVPETVALRERETERDIDIEIEGSRDGIRNRSNGSRSNVSLSQKSSTDPEQITDPRFRPGMTYGEWQAILKADREAESCKH